jgi:GlpG protein
MIELTAFKEQRIALALSDYLRSIGIANHIEIEPDRFAIMLNHPDDTERAHQELDGFLHNPNDARYWQASWQTGQLVKPLASEQDTSIKDIMHNLWARSGIFTLLISVICIVVYLALEAVGKPVFDALSYPNQINDLKSTHEYWRLLTPVFLHFGAMHIIFNLIWWWDLGGLIERTQSKMQLLGVFLATALLSNFAQYLSFGAGFGGLSGVVYGLLGYIWLYPLVNPRIGFRINPAIVMFMVGWLVVGYSGILDSVFGKMANSAHLIGLLTGIGLGVVFGLLHRMTQHPESKE